MLRSNTLKTKSDFVTNSSSSSFIVAWDKIVETFDDVKKHLTCTDHAKIVLGDILNQEPLVLKEGNFDFDLDPVLKGITNRIVVELKTGTFPEDISWREYDHLVKSGLTTQQASKIVKKERMEKAEQIAINFIKNNIGRVIYFFTYADEDGEISSDMEHGDIFRKLPNICINKH